MPRIEEWLVQKPFNVGFSSISNASIVFAKLAEYVVESEGTLNPGVPFIYSKNENVTTFEFVTVSKHVKLTLLYRASEHDFLATKFHELCDDKGSTITLVKPKNNISLIAAAYYGRSWGRWGGSVGALKSVDMAGCGRNGLGVSKKSRKRKGFIASIDENQKSFGGHSFQKYRVRFGSSSYPLRGPVIGKSLSLSNRCNENEYSRMYFTPNWGFVGSSWERHLYPMFGVEYFRVLEYEVFQVELNPLI
jgi:hypothetical protein